MKADLQGTPDQIIQEIERILRTDPQVTEERVQSILSQMKSLIFLVLKEAEPMRFGDQGPNPSESPVRMEKAMQRLGELLGYDGTEEDV